MVSISDGFTKRCAHLEFKFKAGTEGNKYQFIAQQTLKPLNKKNHGH